MIDAVTAPELVLHHYPRSPFAEKIRVAFGLKRLRWRSVVQPRIAPKPQLIPLTGGYRRTPVLQIGADIYCDTACILAELEARFAAPTLYTAGTRGHADIVAAWADRTLFRAALGLVFGLNGARFPPELHADRASFTAGRFDGWDSAKMQAQLPALREEFRVHLRRIDDGLDGRAFLLGADPSLADLAIYHPLWYARENLGEAEGLEHHPRVLSWMDRMAAIGHGALEEMSPDDALDIARNAQPAPASGTAGDDHPWKPGMQLSVTPTDWGFDTVIGEFISAGPNRLALRRHDPAVGAVVVHFPRAGFAIAQV